MMHRQDGYSTHTILQGNTMSFASQFQFAVRKLSFVCHDCSETHLSTKSTTTDKMDIAHTTVQFILKFTSYNGKHMTCNLNVPVTTTDKMDSRNDTHT